MYLGDLEKIEEISWNGKKMFHLKSSHREVFMAIPVFRSLLLSELLLSSSLAGAQPVSSNGTAAPNDSVPSISNFQYFSVFTHYQPFREQPLHSWQETNDNVGKIGGWRFYARDAQQPDTVDSATGNRPDSVEKQPSGPIKTPDHHSGHGRKP